MAYLNCPANNSATSASAANRWLGFIQAYTKYQGWSSIAV